MATTSSAGTPPAAPKVGAAVFTAVCATLGTALQPLLGAIDALPHPGKREAQPIRLPPSKPTVPADTPHGRCDLPGQQLEQRDIRSLFVARC